MFDIKRTKNPTIKEVDEIILYHGGGKIHGDSRKNLQQVTPKKGKRSSGGEIGAEKELASSKEKEKPNDKKQEALNRSEQLNRLNKDKRSWGSRNDDEGGAAKDA